MDLWFVRMLAMQFALMMPVNGLRPMVSYRALELGASPLELGIVAGGFGALSFVFAMPLGRWVDRLGEPLFLALGASTVALAAFLLLPVGNLWVLAGVFAVLGLGQVMAAVGLQTLTSSGGRPEQRDRRFGAFSVTAALSQMVGPPLAGLVFGWYGGSLDAVFLVAASMMGIAVALAVTLLVWPPREHERGPRATDGSEPPRASMRSTMSTVLRQPSVPHAMFVSLAVVSSIDLLTAYLPAYGEANGIPVETVGLLLGLRAAATIASRVGMVAVVRRIGRRRLLAVATTTAMAAMLLLPTTTRPAMLAALIIVGGLGLGMGQPLSLSWITEQVPPAIRGTAVGMRMTANRGTQMVIPIVAGAVAGVTGIGVVFILMGGMLAAGAMVVARAPSAGGGSRETAS
ncbi:MAG: MFS transporter [Nitriliruptoraceae bacterium]